MKIKKSHFIRLTPIKVFSTKFYRKKSQVTYKNDGIIQRLKTALKTIFYYHRKNKKILFVGTPHIVHKKIINLLKNTKHSIISESAWVNGLITNKKFVLKNLMKAESVKSNFSNKILLTIKEKHELIVVLNSETNKKTLSELLTTQVPVISFNSNNLLLLDHNKVSYNIIGDFNFTTKKKKDNLFYDILKSMIKKAKKH